MNIQARPFQGYRVQPRAGLSAPLPPCESSPPPIDRAMFHPSLFLAQVMLSMFFMVAGAAAEGKAEPGGIFGNTYLTCMCAGGCILGGALFIFVNIVTPLKTAESSAVRAIKFIGSVIIGMTFCPWALRRLGLGEEAENVLAFSCLVGFLGWSVVMTLLPWSLSFIPRLIKTIVGVGTGLPVDPPDKSNP